MTADVRIRRMGPLPQVTMRLDPADGALPARLGVALSATPPTMPNTTAAAPDGQTHVLWLGPDEWLIVGPEGSPPATAPTLEAAIREAADGAFVTSVDVSANRVGLEVTGADARGLLAFGCALDLDPRHFGPGSCAQTMVARAGVILWALGKEPAPTFRLLVRPSFATYLETWLRDAENGLA
ncbi:MAG: sarcosine oxidase subunit gamma [Candidatus Limnocylindrales bacterium]